MLTGMSSPCAKSGQSLWYGWSGITGKASCTKSQTVPCLSNWHHQAPKHDTLFIFDSSFPQSNEALSTSFQTWFFCSPSLPFCIPRETGWLASKRQSVVVKSSGARLKPACVWILVLPVLSQLPLGSCFLPVKWRHCSIYLTGLMLIKCLAASAIQWVLKKC